MTIKLTSLLKESVEGQKFEDSEGEEYFLKKLHVRDRGPGSNIAIINAVGRYNGEDKDTSINGQTLKGSVLVEDLGPLEEIQTDYEARILLGRRLYYRKNDQFVGRVTEVLKDKLRIGPKNLGAYIQYDDLKNVGIW